MVTPVAQQSTLAIARRVRAQEKWEDHSAGSLLQHQLNSRPNTGTGGGGGGVDIGHQLRSSAHLK